MPLVKINIREGKSKKYKKALLDGVHQALVQSIKIPDYDRKQRLYELDADNFEALSNKTCDITIIEITMFKGRSIEARKQLFQAMRTGASEVESLPPGWIMDSGSMFEVSIEGE